MRILIVVALLGAELFRGGLQASDGEIAWPAKWTAFGPVDGKAPAIAEAELKSVPQELTINGRKLKANIYDVRDPFGRMNLETLLEKPEQAAYVFLTLTAPSDLQTRIGFGADWWFQAWLDGQPIKDTLKAGNGTWQPSVMDHQATVDLTKGEHVLAVRFIRGVGSAMLAIGGEGLIKKGKPNFLFPLFQNPAASKNNIVANGDFESGLTGWEDLSSKDQKGEKVFTVNTATPITGKGSLEINTLGGAGAANKLAARLPPMRGVYFITFSGRYFDGEHVGVSIRRGVANGPTYALFAVGNASTPGSTPVPKGEKQSYKTYCYVDEEEPCLVIDARLPCRALLDNVCIEPCAEESKVWSTYPHQKAPFDSEWSVLTTEVVTPHAKWSAPSACKKTQVLAMMPRWRQRQVNELNQRFGFPYDAAMFASADAPGPDYWIRDANQEPTLFRVEQDTIKKIVKPLDCMLISHLKPAALSKELVNAVLKRVQDGAGLVVAGAACDAFSDAVLIAHSSKESVQAGTDENFISTLIDTDDRSGFSGKRACRLFGKGRIVLLPGCEEALTRQPYERQLCLTAKALLWASAKLPAVRMGKATINLANGDSSDKLAVDREKLPAVLSMTLSGDTVSSAVKASAWIDDYDGKGIVELERADDGKNASVVSFKLPVLPAGQHYAHLQIEDGGNSCDWTMAEIKVNSAVPIGQIKIKTPDGRPYFIRGEPVAGSVTLTQPLAPGLTVAIRLEDADDNAWAVKEHQGTGQTTLDFSLPSDHLVVLKNSLTVTLLDQKGIVGRRSQHFTCVPRRAETPRMDYQHWSVPGIRNYGYIARLVTAQMRRQGVSGAMCGSLQEALSDNNIRNIETNWPWGWHWGANKITMTGDLDKEPRLEPSLSDPLFRQRYPETVEKYIKPTCVNGPLAYSVAQEENLLGQMGNKEANVDFSPSALVSFREFLQKEYASLPELNKAWGSAFASWDEVGPCSIKDAIASNQAPRWIDHRRHMDRVYSGFTKFRKEIVRRWDSEAEICADNFREPTSYSGVNYWELLQVAAACGGFPDSYVTSFLPDSLRHLAGKHAATWHPRVICDSRELLSLRMSGQIWRNLLSGQRAFSYYSEMFSSPPTSMMYGPLYPDLRPSWLGKDMQESFERIRSGVDRMVFESQPLDSGIGVLYSRASEHASTVWQTAHPDKLTEKTMTARFQEEAYHAAISSLGYGYRSLAEEQIAAGELRKSNLKLLILPFSQALPAASANEIRAWVENGGILLTGLWPAVYDVHGARKAKGLLDDVLGVTQTVSWSGGVKEAKELAFKADAKSLNFSGVIQDVLVGSGVAVDAATANGQSNANPVLMVNRFGKGKSFLLNFAPTAINDGFTKLLKKLLNESGVKPLFAVEYQVSEAPQRTTKPLPAKSADGAENAPADAEGFLGGKIAGAETKPILVDYRHGQTRIFGFWFNDHGGLGERVAQVTAPRNGHIYDLLTNKYLGENRQFTARLPAEGLGGVRRHAIPHRPTNS